jgi:hypothetical protein
LKIASNAKLNWSDQTMNHNQASLNIQLSLNVEPQANGQYSCRIASSLDRSASQQQVFYGQSQNHAIANGLEHLADAYRQAVSQEQEEQNLDWQAVQLSESGQAVQQCYHVVLHYERIAEEESMFEAMHSTIMGNTVVENATIMVMPIDADLPIELITRS